MFITVCQQSSSLCELWTNVSCAYAHNRQRTSRIKRSSSNRIVLFRIFHGHHISVSLDLIILCLIWHWVFLQNYVCSTRMGIWIKNINYGWLWENTRGHSFRVGSFVPSSFLLFAPDIIVGDSGVQWWAVTDGCERTQGDEEWWGVGDRPPRWTRINLTRRADWLCN